jgi:DNA-binding NarL/FixJ family response regulator
MTSGPVRVAIVDDHPMFRIGLAAAISEMEAIELVGEADGAEQVAALVADTSPDIVLLDVRLDQDSGLEVNRWLAEHHPSVKVVMLTMSEDRETALTALRDGACGYLVKGVGPERVEHALRAVASGDVVLDHSLLGAVTDAAHDRRSLTEQPFPNLTRREMDILGLIADGLDNTAIARQLMLSPKTVRNHVSNVFAKIQASDRPAAIVQARRHGLGS